MARLPEPGKDKGTWGEILNEYLSVEHNGDGTLRSDGTLASKAPLNDPTFTGSVTVPEPTSSTDAASKQYVDDQVVAETPDADSTTKGKVQLTGDLSGTAESPTVPGLAAKAPINNPTFTGNVTVPSPTNSTDAVTKAYADSAIDAIPELAEGTGINLTDLGGGVTEVAAETVDFQVFSADGTWTKPDGVRMVQVYAIGGGGGGGKGSTGSEGTLRRGGGGGGGGGLVVATFPAAALSSSVAVTIGSGGAGGTVDGGFNTGGNGGNTTFGSYVSAGGGLGGASGAMALGGGAGGLPGASSYQVGVGGTSADASATFGSPGASAHIGSGGSGCTRKADNTLVTGGAGGASSAGSGGATGGVAVTAGSVGTNGSYTTGGSGGGGGGARSAGGAGGANGGGGGGGGASWTGAGAAGDGGPGGNGYCMVVSII